MWRARSNGRHGYWPTTWALHQAGANAHDAAKSADGLPQQATARVRHRYSAR